MADFDTELRAAALSHVSALFVRSGSLTWTQISDGFKFRGEQIVLSGRARGIFKPRQLHSGVLSVRTVEPRKGRLKRYDDQIGSGEPYFVYRWQGDDPNAADNRGLRECMQRGLPIIYFYGVGEAVYDVLICTITGEDAASQSFRLEPISREVREATPALKLASIPIERLYGIGQVRRRLHQKRFRSVVIEAYDTRCAICRLRHAPLLDAAHIIADGEKLGEARVPNGLALCKLHHAAYDSSLLGISPDLKVHINGALLVERDGPMLEHGLRAFHGQSLVLPAAKEDHPDRELLELRFKSFAA